MSEEASSGALEPHQLTALRARVGHAKIAVKGDVAAVPVRGAGRANRHGVRLDGGDPQLSARGGTGNSRRASVIANHSRAAAAAFFPAKKSMVQRRRVHRSRMVP